MRAQTGPRQSSLVRAEQLAGCEGFAATALASARLAALEDCRTDSPFPSGALARSLCHAMQPIASVPLDLNLRLSKTFALGYN